MAKKLVLFGIGKIGEVVHHHFATDSEYEVVGFAIDREYLPKSGTHKGLPIVAFDEVEKHFAPKEHAIFIGIGYQDMNRLRAKRLAEAKQKGYALATYISSQNKHIRPGQVGEHCFVMSGEPLHPCSKIGDNTYVWTNALVGHHAQVGKHCWITAGAMIGGNTRIGDYCFLGLGATVGHEISIGEASLIGAGALVTKDALAESVYIEAETPRFRLTSSQFLKMGTMK